MLTKKLYEENIYQKECDAEVVSIIEKDNKFLVELNQTIFYPEGGGQTSDIGTIGNANVLDVIEKGDKILHLVDVSPTEKNVKCKIDWAKRLDNMQQHCGEHILSGVIKSRYDGINKGFRMGEDYVTIDINLPKITPEMLKVIEQDANQAIYANVPIHIHQVDTLEDASKFDVRKQITVNEDIRIVEIQGVDCVACCGSHPKSTGDVGIVKLLKAEKYKGMTRIYFKCGQRALTDYQHKHAITSELCKKYSVETLNLLERLQNEESKYNALRDRFNSVKKKINDVKANDLKASMENNVVVSFLESSDADDLTSISKRLMEETSSIVLLGSDLDQKVILTHSGDFDLHCGKLYKEHVKSFNGRGGGGDRMAQAVFTDLTDAKEFFEKISEELKVY